MRCWKVNLDFVVLVTVWISKSFRLSLFEFQNIFYPHFSKKRCLTCKEKYEAKVQTVVQVVRLWIRHAASAALPPHARTHTCAHFTTAAIAFDLSRHSLSNGNEWQLEANVLITSHLTELGSFAICVHGLTPSNTHEYTHLLDHARVSSLELALCVCVRACVEMSGRFCVSVFVCVCEKDIKRDHFQVMIGWRFHAWMNKWQKWFNTLSEWWVGGSNRSTNVRNRCLRVSVCLYWAIMWNKMLTLYIGLHRKFDKLHWSTCSAKMP